MDERQKLWVQVGRGVTAKKRKPENVRLSRTGIMTHNTSYSDDWELANWKGFQKVLFRLQKIIFKAVRGGDRANARKLQKAVLSPHAAKMLAIRQVTPLNQGKKTVGIYDKKFLTFKERFQLKQTLQQHTKTWKHQNLWEISLPKKGGTKRTLKISTMADRAWQCLIKYALEPAHEATFHARSYGFRPGRSTHDAQKIMFLHLSSRKNGINKKILKLDIAKCFDRISHEAILDKVIAPNFLIKGLRRCLKAGVNPEFPHQGTPQGGVCSPLLANIALNGIEKIGEVRKGRDTYSICVKYVDDMVFVLKPENNAEKLLVEIQKFLAQRGMKINQEKTKVTASRNGVDFLG
jgi:RNA-directed DNA polymerase